MQLDDRKRIILQAIIRNYLETGEPVGSRTISKYTDLNLSSATIRNEMSDLEEMGYTCKQFSFSDSNDLSAVASSACTASDVLYVPTDNIIASAMPVLTKITTPAKVPVITGEEGPLHGGGLATVGVDYYELGKIAGNMGADILEGKAKPADMPIQYQKEFKVKVNEPVLKTLGLQLPESLKGKAELGDFH